MSRNAASVTYIDNVSSSPSISRSMNYARHASYDEFDFLCKLLVIGDSGCGKSALLTRFGDNEFHTGYSSTIGVDFALRTIDYATKSGGNKVVKLQMWDTAGQERFRTITSAYYRGAHAVLIVFDVTSESSFSNCRKWLAELDEVCAHFDQQQAQASLVGGAKGAPAAQSVAGAAARSMQVLLVANKTDLVRSRVVERHRIEQLAEELGLPFVEASAKSGCGVGEAFVSVAGAFVEQRMRDEAEGRYHVGGPGGLHGAKHLKVHGASLADGEQDDSAGKKCLGLCTIM